MSIYTDKDKWFKDGLKFECTKCGKCCTGHNPPDTYILVSLGEIVRLAEHLKITPADFLVKYTVVVPKGRSLKAVEDRCVFLDKETNQCTIHEARPNQCRAFPFWPGILENEAGWKNAAARCEGIGQGNLIGEEEILARLKEHIIK